VLSFPIVLLFTMRGPALQWAVDGAGVALWVVGMLFEAIADYQVASFSRTKRPGQILTSGLFRYSRHPNYFGEALLWLGIAVVVSSVEWGALALLSPVLLTFLLLRVSGVPLLERKWRDNPEYQSYKARTSVFVPMLPRSA
jgi:steroid 5-alpha reductase family enzyme